MGSCNLWSLKMFMSAHLLQIAREKSFDYLLIVYIQKFKFFSFNFNFLHSNFNFLHCLGLIDMLSANQHGESFACILLETETMCITKPNYNESLCKGSNVTIQR